MKTLYIIRHAKSSWEFDVSDEKRPLNKRGLNDAALIGEKLTALLKPIDKILCSPAERAHSTAKIILSYLDIPAEIFKIEPLLYDFSGNDVTKVIKNCSDDINTLLIFGHNHAFTSIANLYGDTYIDNLPTAGVIGIEFPVTSWKNIKEGKTVLKLYPKLLK
ncbi:SixA phosphatase family protein [Aquimarina algicola]|uniref:Histidine phosphatase family protein n=1 Tax=Aquimarina algicola TaxID=2589995 RepID=A0A504JRA4_9FLAO|nr:histidine phosphatase family protein [Aquimarina algicola]TPN88890.1 hypothetical protein FHK87_01355 [Aquimarina algicola]